VPVLEREGAKLFYEEAGSGPPIVFVHGWTCNHAHFAPQYSHFGRDHQVVAVDLRGHGSSDPSDSYSVEEFADDVAWMIGELSLTKPVIVGHSMGALVAVAVAARHPELLSAIVLVDAAPLVVGDDIQGLLAMFADQFDGPDHLEARRGLIEGMLFAPGDDPERKAAIVADMLSTPQPVAAGAWRAIIGFDGAGALAAVTVPALHIACASPINDAAALRAANPLMQTGQTVGAGHFNHLEVPDQVSPMIERFLVTLGS
jgi:pimeloyl-ACP methyl ester carboxylesterase